MKLIKLLLIIICLSGCTSRQLIITSASSARLMEAARDAEAFQKPTEDRSLTWHLLKVPQVFCWTIWGYHSYKEFKKKPTLENLIVPVFGLGAAWFTFETSLYKFREMQR